jgi:hypothetical protein
VRCDGQECSLQVDHFSLPAKLACALAHFRKLQQRWRRPLGPLSPFPHLTGIVFDPRHLQRFPRSCVLLTARRLATGTPPGGFAMRQSVVADWIDCILMRVLSGIVKKVEVRRLHGGVCDVLAITTVLIPFC